MKKFFITILMILAVSVFLFADRVNGSLLIHFANNDCGGDISVWQYDAAHYPLGDVWTQHFPAGVDSIYIMNDPGWDTYFHYYSNCHSLEIRSYPANDCDDTFSAFEVDLSVSVDYEASFAFYKSAYMKTVDMEWWGTLHLYNTSYFTVTGEMKVENPGPGGGNPDDYGVRIQIQNGSIFNNLTNFPCDQWDTWQTFHIYYCNDYKYDYLFLDAGTDNISIFSIYPPGYEYRTTFRNVQVSFEYVPDIDLYEVKSYHTGGNNWHPRLTWHYTGFPTDWQDYFEVEIWRKQVPYVGSTIDWQQIATCDLTDAHYIDTELTSPSDDSGMTFAIDGNAYYKIRLKQTTDNPNWDFCPNFPDDSEWNDTFAFSSEHGILYGENTHGGITPPMRGTNILPVENIIIMNGKISFSLQDDSKTKTEINLYNLKGQHIKTICDNFLNNGKYTYKVSTANLASGVYFYQIRHGNFETVRKSVLIR